MSTRRRKTLQPWLAEQRAKEEQARAAWEALAAETRAWHRAQREQVQRDGVMHGVASYAGFLLDERGPDRVRDAGAGAGSLGLRP